MQSVNAVRVTTDGRGVDALICVSHVALADCIRPTAGMALLESHH